MAIIWDAPEGQQAEVEKATEIAWRMFLVQTLTGLTEDAEHQARTAEQRRGALAPTHEIGWHAV